MAKTIAGRLSFRDPHARGDVELRSVGRHAILAERRGVCDGIELEVVDVAVELELHHPVDELCRRHQGGGRRLGMQVQQSAAGVADDAAGVVGAR
ncbi:MAG: hypothetical protein ACRDPJ_19020 [Nocardioidaceae bacterium]